jgi:hypothetical protein
MQAQFEQQQMAVCHCYIAVDGENSQISLVLFQDEEIFTMSGQ